MIRTCINTTEVMITISESIGQRIKFQVGHTLEEQNRSYKHLILENYSIFLHLFLAINKSVFLNGKNYFR